MKQHGPPGMAFESIMTSLKGRKRMSLYSGSVSLRARACVRARACACVLLRADSCSQRALALLWLLPLVPLYGLSMSSEITFIMGQSETRLPGGVHSRVEQTPHVSLDTAPTQNGMNAKVFFSYLTKTWPREMPDQSVKTANMLNSVTGEKKKKKTCIFLIKQLRKTFFF